MKNLINNFKSFRLDAGEIKYVVGGMNNQGQPQAAGCVRDIVKEAVVSGASDGLKEGIRDAAKSDWFNQIKENFNRHVKNQIDIQHMTLQAEYPHIEGKR